MYFDEFHSDLAKEFEYQIGLEVWIIREEEIVGYRRGLIVCAHVDIGLTKEEIKMVQKNHNYQRKIDFLLKRFEDFHPEYATYYSIGEYVNYPMEIAKIIFPQPASV